MRPTNLTAAASRLDQCVKNLRMRWDAAREGWTDRVAEEFEAAHLAPLERRVVAVRQAADQLRDVLSQAQRDCE